MAFARLRPDVSAAAGLAAGAVTALFLTLFASVRRRRRDLAVLKTIGFARQIYAVPLPAVPVISVVLLPLCAVALVNLVAALPGRSAARTPAALALRAE